MKILIYCLLLLSLPAQAGILMEPYAGYAQSLSDSNAGYLDTSLSYSSPFVGAKLGFTAFGLSGGVDVVYQRDHLRAKNQYQNLRPRFKRADTGVFLGFRLPALFRFYGKYILSSEFETDIWDAVEPSGAALGIGYPLALFSINVEYRNLSWEKIDTYQGRRDVSEETKLSDILLSISLPINL